MLKGNFQLMKSVVHACTRTAWFEFHKYYYGSDFLRCYTVAYFMYGGDNYFNIIVFGPLLPSLSSVIS